MSFSIKRFRTRDEPRRAAWAKPNTPSLEERLWQSSTKYFKCPNKGEGSCATIHRGPGPWFPGKKLDDGLRLDEDDPEDGIRCEGPTNEYHSDSDTDPLECRSGVSENDEEGAEDHTKDGTGSESSNGQRWNFSVPLGPCRPSPPEFDAEFLPLCVTYHLESDHEDEEDEDNDNGERDDECQGDEPVDGKNGEDRGDDEEIDERTEEEIRREEIAQRRWCYHKLHEYEHIPGPSCKDATAYNGHRVSFDQMMACTTAQCLATESQVWVSEPDGMDFEEHSGYHLLVTLISCHHGALA